MIAMKAVTTQTFVPFACDVIEMSPENSGEYLNFRLEAVKSVSST
jgi:hypothetical protein